MKRLISNISGIAKLTDEAYKTLSTVSEVNYVSIFEEKDLMDCLQKCDVFWFRLNHKITSKVLERSRCKYLLCAVTGLDHIDLEACEKRGITIISLKNEKDFLKEVRATAEHSFGLMLALIRKSKTAFKHVESYQWNRNLFQGEELYKKRIGILGLGRLGEIVAGYAKAFGMEVFYYDKSNINTSTYTKCSSLEELITNIDILSIHITYDDSTHFMINSDILSIIEHPIYIINTSRGGVVNESSILEYLINDKIKGYATDVLYKEPKVEMNKLIQYASENENVIITPHIGGYTFESIEKTEIFIANKFIETYKINNF